MKIDGALLWENLKTVADRTRELQRIGYDGIYTFEGSHDGLLPLATAALASDQLELSAQVAIAFSRNPLQLAYQLNDIHLAAEGRFFVGLGTQVKANIERRFSMPWGKPVTRMRNFVGALHAIFRSWNEGTPLHFESEYYTHTKMQPFFAPSPNQFGRPKIALGGVGRPMTRLAGEIGDGFVVLPFHTPRFLETFTMPALREGLELAGRAREDFSVSAMCMIVTAQNERAYRAAFERTRFQVAFYGTTPNYKKCLDAEGWGELHPELHQLVRENRWMEIPTLISDEMVERIAVCGAPEAVADQLWARFKGVADRISIMTPYALDDESAAQVVSRLKELRDQPN